MVQNGLPLSSLADKSVKILLNGNLVLVGTGPWQAGNYTCVATDRITRCQREASVVVRFMDKNTSAYQIVTYLFSDL